MSDSITYVPDSPMVGSPISVTVISAVEGEAKSLSIVRKDGEQPPPFEASLQRQGAREWTTQFALYEAGAYELRAGNTVEMIRVIPRVTVPFFDEMVIWGGLVAIILGGLIVWSRRKAEKVGFF